MNRELIDFFSDFALKHTGIVLGPEKDYLIKSRLEELSKSLGFRNIEELYRKAKYQLTNELLDHLIDALTTNETYFFRDKIQFDALKKYILPEIIERKKEEKRLRIWSCACSTGQEPYSIGILICEHFPHILNWDLEIIGSDISKRAVEYAKQGSFSQIEVNRGLPAKLLIKYFRQKGSRWVIDERVRRLIRFLRINLKDDFSYLGKFDIIFCRYVLIYFSSELKRNVLLRIEKNMFPNGYLFFGMAEIPSGLSPRFIRRDFGGAICYQFVP